MVHIEEVKNIESIPRLYTLTLSDDGSPEKDKSVSIVEITEKINRV